MVIVATHVGNLSLLCVRTPELNDDKYDLTLEDEY